MAVRLPLTAACGGRCPGGYACVEGAGSATVLSQSPLLAGLDADLSKRQSLRFLCHDTEGHVGENPGVDLALLAVAPRG